MKVALALLSIVFVVGCTTETTVGKMSNFEGSGTVRTSVNSNDAAAARVASAQQYVQIRNLERAKFHLDKAAAHNDSYPDLYFTLGFYYQLAKDNVFADRSFKKALELDKNNPDYQNAYGQFLCSIQEYDKAQELFDRVIKNPTYSNAAQTYVNAGVCKKAQGKDQEAADYFIKALNINGKLPSALAEVAQYEFDKERYQRSLSYLKRYLEVAQHTPSTLWLGLRAESRLGNKNAVASYALRLEQMYPDSKETLLFLDTRDQW